MSMPKCLLRTITKTQSQNADVKSTGSKSKSCFVFITNNDFQYVAYTRNAISSLRRFLPSNIPVFVLTESKDTVVPEADDVINISEQMKKYNLADLAFRRFPAIIFAKFLMPYIKELSSFDRVIIYDPDVDFRSPKVLDLLSIPFDGQMALLVRDPNHIQQANKCLKLVLARKLVGHKCLSAFKKAYEGKKYGNVGLIVWNMNAIRTPKYDEIVKFIPTLQKKTGFSLPEQDCMFCTIPSKMISDTYNALVKFTKGLSGKAVWHYTGDIGAKTGLKKICRRTGFDKTFSTSAGVLSRELLDRDVQNTRPEKVKGYAYVGRPDPVSFLFPGVESTTKSDGKNYKACFPWDSVDSGINYEAIRIAKRDNCPIVLCESGPIGSITPHNAKSLPIEREVMSVISDMHAYNYDSYHSSDLERYISTCSLDSAALQRAKKNIAAIVENKISKYNHQPLEISEPGTPGRRKVLVVDQDVADTSVFLARGTKEAFDKMLADAISENPDADVLVKTHPIDIIGNKTTVGCYTGVSGKNVVPITYPANPFTLMEYVDKVYVSSSAFGFEALMAGKEVHTYGIPWYAGWGLTKDYYICPRRNKRKSLEELFHCFYIWYCKWYNPISKRQCELEEVIETVKVLRDMYMKRQQ